MSERKEWCLRTYKRDRRYKSGERLVDVKYYKDWTVEQMAAEVKSLRSDLYPVAKFRLEYYAAWVEVRNLMTGQPIKIAADQQGTCLDPSQERFWCS